MTRMTRKGELDQRMDEGKESIDTRTTRKLQENQIFLVRIESNMCVGKNMKEDKARLRKETGRTRNG
jgi:hypothetical protein